MSDKEVVKAPVVKKVTTSVLRKMKEQGERISMLTSYDFSMATIIDRAGMDVILVGDSASNVMAGNPTTLLMTLDQIIYHAQCVVRAVKRAHVVVDLPFGCYEASDADAVRSAVRIMKESGADSIKIEGGEEMLSPIKKIIDAGMIPGIAINPGTSVETVMMMLTIVKKVLVMSVNPGNAGQMYLPYVGQKIDKLIELREQMDFEIYWDGACSAEKILEYAPKGVNGFVLGTTLLFGKGKPYGEVLKDIHKLKF